MLIWRTALKGLFELLRIPSISADPAYAGDVRRAAEWLVADLKSIGFEASARDTTGHPMVVAHGAGPAGTPHMLFYGHYDVQPVDPLELWESDPFAPAVKDPGRGAQDHHRTRSPGRQGPVDDLRRGLPGLEEGARHPALQPHPAFRGRGGIGLAVTGALPRGACRGAEGRRRAGLRHRHVGPRDAGHHIVGLRGLVGEEITIQAADRDLHSGEFGGAAAQSGPYPGQGAGRPA